MQIYSPLQLVGLDVLMDLLPGCALCGGVVNDHGDCIWSR